MINLTSAIAKNCPRDKTLMGLDVGGKTIGIALSAPPYSIITPHTTIKRTKFTKDMAIIGQIVADYDIGGFVIGLPLNMDGNENVQTQRIRDFAAEMINHPNVVGANPWIALQDERLSTDAVRNTVDDIVGFSHHAKAKDKGMIDTLAAKLILEDGIRTLKSVQF